MPGKRGIDVFNAALGIAAAYKTGKMLKDGTEFFLIMPQGFQGVAEFSGALRYFVFQVVLVSLVFPDERRLVERFVNGMDKDRKLFHRLGEIIPSPETERLDDIVHLSLAGDDDERNIRRFFRECGQDLKPVHPWHAQIDEYQVRPPRPE